MARGLWWLIPVACSAGSGEDEKKQLALPMHEVLHSSRREDAILQRESAKDKFQEVTIDWGRHYIKFSEIFTNGPAVGVCGDVGLDLMTGVVTPIRLNGEKKFTPAEAILKEKSGN